MRDHVCGPPYALKAGGTCLCCREPVYQVIDTWADGPLAGTPRRIGRMLETGTQVEFLMSDGSEADITFCRECAAALQPEWYAAVWRACVDRLELSLSRADRSDNERAASIATALAVWPIALVRKRREGLEPGTLVVDRR